MQVDNECINLEASLFQFFEVTATLYAFRAISWSFLDWTWNGRKQFTIDYHFYFLCLLQGCSYPIRVYDWLQIVNAMTTELSGKRKLIVTPPTPNLYLICIVVMSGEEPLIDTKPLLFTFNSRLQLSFKIKITTFCHELNMDHLWYHFNL